MRLFAISDLHLSYPQNRRALSELSSYPEDWLIVAGDVGETEPMVHSAFRQLTARFARVIWTPGNHDLWTMPSEKDAPAGVAKYERLVTICRSYGVITPEDPFVPWPGSDPPTLLAPTFTLYDYSFRPASVSAANAVAWAERAGIVFTDEYLLHPDPYPTRSAWCAARIVYTEARLQAVGAEDRLILINHYPLRYDLAQLPYLSLWCGTTRSEDWHLRFPVDTVVYGHLHMRGSRSRDGVPFEEVSYGYPHQRRGSYPLSHYLRDITPGTRRPSVAN